MPHPHKEPAQVQSRIDPAQQMIARNHIFEIEFIEKTVLPTYRLTHHRPDPVAPSAHARNHKRPSRSKDFFDSLSYDFPSQGALRDSELGAESGSAAPFVG
jgi:hypothetical protein